MRWALNTNAIRLDERSHMLGLLVYWQCFFVVYLVKHILSSNGYHRSDRSIHRGSLRSAGRLARAPRSGKSWLHALESRNKEKSYSISIKHNPQLCLIMTRLYVFLRTSFEVFHLMSIIKTPCSGYRNGSSNPTSNWLKKNIAGSLQRA